MRYPGDSSEARAPFKGKGNDVLKEGGGRRLNAWE